MISRINEWFRSYYRKRFEKKNHRELHGYLLDIFRKHGEGLYYVNIKSRMNTWTSRAISFFTHGWVHSVIFLYAEDVTEWLSEGQLCVLVEKLKFYYADPPAVRDIKVWVLGSADDSGINFFDFSVYQNREFTIRKVVPRINETLIIHFCLSRADRPYDVTGLLFWWPFRLFDDELGYYCSEFVYDAMIYGGVKIAEKDNPSPYGIEKYRRDWIIFEQEDTQ